MLNQKSRIAHAGKADRIPKRRPKIEEWQGSASINACAKRKQNAAGMKLFSCSLHAQFAVAP
eukprot:1753943-Amphidinium_carterae.1